MRTVRYHEAAEQELLSEIGYLENCAEDLGRRFLTEILKAEDFLVEFPEAAEELLPGIRKYSLRKFRYSLIYVVEQDAIYVLAIAHQSRRPGYWITRIH
ncbi:MAG: type II toxin-antitoxin system RelE/ParE family toxin [Acidobacteriia bacterium]|nr:type II toxin-antitoxin system RelE/ParE family toxin [Terriglobia bacterium]